MFSGLQSQQRQDDLQRDAYNAAFYELGFSWYWDRDTYEELMQRASDASQRIRLYLESRQPHLLRAYDADFLVATIEAAKSQHARRGTAAAFASSAGVDWAQLSGCQVGA